MCGGKIFKTLRWFECRQTGLGLCHVTANCQPSFGRPKISLEVKNLVVLLSAQWLHCRLLGLLITFSGLAKVAIFTTNVDAENQCLINHKCVCGALNRHFCQTRVIGWRSCLSWVTTIFMSSVCVICRVLFCLACVSGVLFFFEALEIF